ncbi:MAG: glycosyltransferase family 4 protein [Rhizomicrobium sp.]
MFATGVARGFCCEDPLSAEGQRDASAPPASKTVVFFANTSWYLWNFRLTLAKRLQNRGFRVVFVAPHHDDFSSRLSGAGEFIPIRISRDGMHPVMEFGTLICFWLLVRRLDAHVVLSWTPKCNIYGGLACRSLGIPIIPNVSGLGSAFVDPTRLARIVAYLYRHAFKKCGPVFFQNSQDMENLIDWGCIGRNSAKLLPGSGVDLNRFIPGSMDALEERDQFVFLFMGRLLREKGLRELATAMRRIREDGLKARLLVVGFVDKANPSGLDAVELDAWVQEGLLEHLGETDMPESFFCRADCVVHPSFYREGLARVLLEAAACGRPVITTDVAGCREAVVPEVSGFLCKPRDADSLYGAMKRMLLLPGSVRQEMGVAARKHMERGFSEEIVIESYFDALHAIAA